MKKSDIAEMPECQRASSKTSKVLLGKTGDIPTDPKSLLVAKPLKAEAAHMQIIALRRAYNVLC
ncbi:MAG: hypothetical protein H7A44_12160 [Opitutaceae bacterium]|nr:hypothetical protein [Opitutaceae bacterium]